MYLLMEFESLTDIWNFIIGNIIIINIILSIIIVFFQRRDPKTVWTWLLVLYFIPVFGIFIYLILGQDYRKSKMFKVKEMEDALHYSVTKQERFFRERTKGMENLYIYNYVKLIRYNLNSGASMFTVYNKVDIFNNGRDKFKNLIADIKAAQKYIHIEYYIIKNDYLFDAIAKELVLKARQGVEVRILGDGMGVRFMPEYKWNQLKAEGIKVGIFFPAMLSWINPRINYRNHRKIVVIDDNIGSPQMNFMDALVNKIDDSNAELKVGNYTLSLPLDKASKLIKGGYDKKQIVLGVRPEDIHDSEIFISNSPSSVIEAEVKVYELLGAEVFLYCDFEQTQITARVNPRTNLRSGDKAVFALDLEKIHLFDKDSGISITGES